MKNLVIFASGNGSNAQAIIDYFKEDDSVSVSLIVCNKKGAGIIDRAENEDIPYKLISREDFRDPTALINLLENQEPALIILAGFLWLIPAELLVAFPNKFINIHPALLPKYGGKGMYGMNVHRAVVENKEPETGITIHWLNEKYDEGKFIFQAKTEVKTDDSAETVAQKVLKLEHHHFPRVIDSLLKEKTEKND